MPETILGSPIQFEALAAEAAARVSASALNLASVIDASAPTFDWGAFEIDSSAVDDAARLVYAGSTGDPGPLYWSNDYTVEGDVQAHRHVERHDQPAIMPYIEWMRANDCCGFAGQILRCDDEMPEHDISDDEFDRVLEECG